MIKYRKDMQTPMNPAAPCVMADSAVDACNDRKVVFDGPGVPLTFCKTGDSGTIVSITGRENSRRFLNELGFTPGAAIRIVSQSGGNLILDVKGSKIAIDRSMASKILYCPSS